jgi:dienelactone hydrolase
MLKQVYRWCATRPHIYNRAAAEDAWQKTLAWFRKYLA